MWGMHSKIFKHFEVILANYAFRELVAGSVLEVGAVPTKDSLLHSAFLADAARRIGVNLDGGCSMKGFAEPEDRPSFEILTANANEMPFFRDGEFQVVLNNATLEHDPYFWKSIAEMRRVLALGGLMIVGVPGYVREVKAPNVPLATFTHRVHDWPGDYYRFSEQSCREVFFEGFEIFDQTVVLVGGTPKIITSGLKRQ